MPLGLIMKAYEYIEDEIGVEAFLREIREELKSHRYHPKPVLRCCIDKPGKPRKVHLEFRLL